MSLLSSIRDRVVPALLFMLLPGHAFGDPFVDWLTDSDDLYQDLAPPLIVPIGAIQGQVSDAHRGTRHESPREGLRVTVQGVVHQSIVRQDQAGDEQHGFFLQNSEETADGDPATSDGIFVSLLTRRDSRMLYRNERYVPTPGDEIVLTGTVQELFGLTRLTAPVVREVLRTGLDLDTELPPFEIDPPDDAEEAERYWERREGMRAVLPAGSISQQGRRLHEAAQRSSAVFIHPGHPVALRDEPSHRRVFRDAHPLDNQPHLLVDDGNGFRIHVGNLGLLALFEGAEAHLPPLRTFDRLTEPAIGAIYQFQDIYSLQPAAPLSVARGLDPFADAPPAPPYCLSNLRIASFNVENLYDHRNDPDSLCDHPDDPGNEWVQPPFNYLPEDQAAYTSRLARLASQIIDGMGAPDLILAQEVENQDMLTIDEDGTVREGADGALDTLQELCVAILAAGGPRYETAVNRHGADPRGILSPYLYRPERLELIVPEPTHPILGDAFTLQYASPDLAMNREVANPKCFNAPLPADLPLEFETDGTNVFTRPVQLAVFRLLDAPEGTPLLYALNNHFSSGPGRRVDQRREQARLNAILAQRIAEIDPNAWIVVGGDLNTFPRPDEPDPHRPADQLGPLYDVGLLNLYDGPLAERPEWNYTYAFRGQAQTLDHLFLSPSLWARVEAAWIAHLNTDWPEGPEIVEMFGASDHDPVMADIRLSSVPMNRTSAKSRKEGNYE